MIRKAILLSTSGTAGNSNIVFRIDLEKRKYILKTCDYSAHYLKVGGPKGAFHRNKNKPKHRVFADRGKREKHLMKEISFLTKFPSTPAIPQVFGYCTSENFTWLLLEPAEHSLLDIQRDLNISNSTFAKMVLPIIDLFIRYDNMRFGTDLADSQFAISMDNRVMIVDLDILRQSKPTDFQQGKQCNKQVECDVRHKPRYSHCVKNTCLAKKCVIQPRSKHLLCLLGATVLKRLSHSNGIAQKLYVSSQLQPSQRPTLEEVYNNLNMTC